jgi:hypothetical protein
MAKQPARTPNPDAPADRPAQPEKSRRTRAGGAASRSQAQATAAAAAEEAGARVDVSEAENRSISMGSSPSEEDIRLRAYQRYLERGGGHGMDFEDWLEAERELKKER